MRVVLVVRGEIEEMGGGKEEEKVISPMFPRLHVNDTDKGGPRAPPRNKMALYEQLSIPSQKFSSGSTQVLPFPLNNDEVLILSKSSNHGGRNESSMIATHYKASAPSHSVGKLHSNSFSAAKSNQIISNHELKSMKQTNSQSSNSMEPLPLTMKLHSFQPHSFFNFKSSSKNSRNEDDIKVPTFACSISSLHSDDNRYAEKLPHLFTSSSLQLQMDSEKLTKGIVTDPKSSHNVTNHPRKTLKTSMTSQSPVERSDSVPSNVSKIWADSTSGQSNKVQKFESFKRSHSSLNQENKNSSVNGLHGTKARLCQEIPQRDGSAHGDDCLVDSVKRNDLKLVKQSCLRSSGQDNCRSPHRLDTDNECGKDMKCRSKPASEIGRHGDVSNASMVYCITTVDITPDDVVGVIGEKQFWKARKAIVNQQRVFAVQVFELHRLIKVQKLIAGSPHLLFEDDFSLSRPSGGVYPEKNFHTDNAQDPPSLLVKPKDNSQKRDTSVECVHENAVGTVLLASINNNPNKELAPQIPYYGPYHVNEPLPSVSTSVKPSPWFFPHPSGNQWLVPVMSPSEGLVYKPYTGLRPQAAGFMTPIYSSYGPMSVTPGGGEYRGEYLNTAYSAPPPHQQGIVVLPGNSSTGQTYFSPYGMPVVHPSNSGLVVEQMNRFARSESNDDDKKCNLSLGQMSKKSQASKECDRQGSTASSPSNRTAADALPPFPVSPTLMESAPARVIKVVPHNPGSATESAARIFRTIQEERKQFDSKSH